MVSMDCKHLVVRDWVISCGQYFMFIHWVIIYLRWCIPRLISIYAFASKRIGKLEVAVRNLNKNCLQQVKHKLLQMGSIKQQKRFVLKICKFAFRICNLRALFSTKNHTRISKEISCHLHTSHNICVNISRKLILDLS